MNKSITINFTASIYDFADIKKAISDSAKVAREVNANDAKSRAKQLRRDN